MERIKTHVAFRMINVSCARVTDLFGLCSIYFTDMKSTSYIAKDVYRCTESGKIKFPRFGDHQLKNDWINHQFSSVQSLSHVQLFAIPWIAARQASLSITNSRSSPKPMSIESVMPSIHLILCRPLLLLPPIPPSITVFSNESTLRIRWPKHWSFSFSISPFIEHPRLISFRMDWLDLLSQSKGLSRVFSNTTAQKHQFFCTQLSSQSNSHIHTWPLEKP